MYRTNRVLWCEGHIGFGDGKAVESNGYQTVSLFMHKLKVRNITISWKRNVQKKVYSLKTLLTCLHVHMSVINFCNKHTTSATRRFDIYDSTGSTYSTRREEVRGIDIIVIFTVLSHEASRSKTSAMNQGRSTGLGRDCLAAPQKRRSVMLKLRMKYIEQCHDIILFDKR